MDFKKGQNYWKKKKKKKKQTYKTRSWDFRGTEQPENKCEQLKLEFTFKQAVYLCSLKPAHNHV